MKVTVICPQCGTTTMKETGAVNRANSIGAPIFCGRTCAGLFRRSKERKTPEQKRMEKSEYDRKRREILRDEIKIKKAAAYKANPNREREAAYRKANMARHVEYCRNAKYVAWKREYDKQYRAKQEFGEFWESAILVNEIRAKALELAGGDYELRLAKGTLNKFQQRRRAYERLDRKEPEDGALGDLERGERW